MKLLVLQFLSIALVGKAFGAAVENCHTARFTACGDSLAEYRKEMGTSFPTTLEQVNELCSKMDEAYTCAENFQNKCMTPLQVQTIGFLTEGTMIAYDDFCTDGSQLRTDYLKHASCIDESSKTDEAKEHYSYIEAALEVFSEKEPKDRLPAACCGYTLLNKKFMEIGEAKCGKEAVDAFQKVIQMVSSSLPDVMCSGFEPEGKQCKAVLPPPGTKPKGSLKNSHVAKAFASIYLPDLE